MCTEGVVLITGGSDGHFNRFSQVEIWGPDGLNRSLSDLPQGRFAHTVFYINAYFLLCGGYDSKEDCLKGEIQQSSKGEQPKMIACHF